MDARKLKIEDNTGTDKNEYYDILTTEDCLIDVLDQFDPVWCNGSAAVSKTVSGGSIPSTGAKK